MKVTVEARANYVRSDLKKRAEELDARHPGSTFAQQLASYGKYCVLGPFAYVSSLLNSTHLWTLLVYAYNTTDFRDFRTDVIFSTMQKRGGGAKCALNRRIGLFISMGWAQHIVYHWRASDDFDLLSCNVSP